MAITSVSKTVSSGFESLLWCIENKKCMNSAERVKLKIHFLFYTVYKILELRIATAKVNSKQWVDGSNPSLPTK
jgi:hypothetical protein